MNELQAPLLSPTRVHLDALGIGLSLVFVACLVAGLAARIYVRRRWPAHPVRRIVFTDLSRAAFAGGIVVAVVGACHLAGVEVYGSPAAALLALSVVLASAIWARIVWLVSVRPTLLRYDQKFPEAADRAPGAPRARMPRQEGPLLWAGGLGLLAYIAFIWHPWPHLLHEGNFILGGLAGYALGSMYAIHGSDLPSPPHRPKPAAGRARPGSRRRH